jgi:hypothetical protein
VSVQTGYWSDGLQGRSRLEKPLRKWLDGGEEAMRRLTNVLWCPGRRGLLDAMLRRVGAGGGLSGRERDRSATLRLMMMSFICSCRNKKEEPSSIYTLRKVGAARALLQC